MNDHEKKFIRANWLKMTEAQLAHIIGCGRFAIQQFKREEGLVKYKGNKKKRA